LKVEALYLLSREIWSLWISCFEYILFSWSTSVLSLYHKGLVLLDISVFSFIFHIL
jgi:hypothetical protein